MLAVWSTWWTGSSPQSFFVHLKTLRFPSGTLEFGLLNTFVACKYLSPGYLDEDKARLTFPFPGKARRLEMYLG